MYKFCTDLSRFSLRTSIHDTRCYTYWSSKFIRMYFTGIWWPCSSGVQIGYDCGVENASSNSRIV